MSLGFSAALRFIHIGKQLSFVYDLADLYKLELSVPVAFQTVSEGEDDVDRRVRIALRDRFRETRFIERVANDLMTIFGTEEKGTEVLDDDPSRPGGWSVALKAGYRTPMMLGA